MIRSSKISLEKKLSDLGVFLFPEPLPVAGVGGGIKDVDRSQKVSEQSTPFHNALGFDCITVCVLCVESEIININHFSVSVINSKQDTI